MPTWRNKPANRQYLNKRYTPAQKQERRNKALSAVRRLYCDVFKFWQKCPRKECRRYRRCTGAPYACLTRGWPSVPESLHEKARAEVIAGGPRRRPPADHTEWGFRQYPPWSMVRE